MIGNQNFDRAEALMRAAAHVEDSLAEERSAHRQVCPPPLMVELSQPTSPVRQPTTYKCPWPKIPLTFSKGTFASENKGLEQKRKDQGCFNCGKTGHFAKILPSAS